MADTMSVHATLDTEMRFDVTLGSGDKVRFDGKHVDGHSPVEMLLASLAACSGISVISILQKKQEMVTNYEVFAHGVRAETYQLVFLEIDVEHVITGRRVRKVSVERAIELAETRYCIVSIMLGKATKLTHTYRIVEAEEL